GDGFVREQPDPDLAAAFDGARHGDARRFDLPIGDPRALHGLQPILAERNRGAAPCLAGHAPALLLSVLDLLRHHHGSRPSVLTCSLPGCSQKSPGWPADSPRAAALPVGSPEALRPPAAPASVPVSLPVSAPVSTPASAAAPSSAAESARKCAASDAAARLREIESARPRARPRRPAPAADVRPDRGVPHPGRRAARRGRAAPRGRASAPAPAAVRGAWSNPESRPYRATP